MAKVRVTVVLTQYLNPKYVEPGLRVAGKAYPPVCLQEYAYQIEELTNTTDLCIGKLLLKDEVDALIDQEWNVKIKGVK